MSKDINKAILMKFGKRKNLENLQHGQLYMKPLSYYTDLANNTNNNTVGDFTEGSMILRNLKIIEPKEYENVCTDVSFNFHLEKYPVFCMFVLNDDIYYKSTFDDAKEKKHYRFNADQVKNMCDFGDSVLIINNTKEFFKRIESALIENGYHYKRDFVEYYNYDENNIEMVQKNQQSPWNAAFCKSKIYEYQQEYRILVKKEVEDFLCIDMDDISDISTILDSDAVLNCDITIFY